MANFCERLRNLFVGGPSPDGHLFDSSINYLRNQYHLESIIGPKVNEQIRNQFFTLEIDTIKLQPGNDRTINIYTVVPFNLRKQAEYAAAKKLHDVMIKSYHNHRFVVSASIARDLVGQFDGQLDVYYQIWRMRCNDLMANPPGSGWNGVYVPAA